MTAATDAFAQLMRIAGKAPPTSVAITEDTPGLKTRFHAEAAAAAALAATGAMAADLWTQRTGQTQNVTVSTREAGAALLSFAFQNFTDPSRAPPPRCRASVRSRRRTCATHWRAAGRISRRSRAILPSSR